MTGFRTNSKNPGAAVLFALLLSACSGVIPSSGGVRGPSTQAGPQLGYESNATSPVPVPPLPYRPATTRADQAATPIPATARPPLPAAPARGDGLTAAASFVQRGPAIGSLGIEPARAVSALAAFRLSCPGLQKRQDRSGLTQGGDWAQACAAAANASDRDAIGFFERYLTPVQIADGKTFATGYFEPEIAGSRRRQSGYEVPVYGRPRDLIDVDLGQFNDELAGKKVRGKVEGTSLVLYDDRTAIEQGSLEGRAPIIAWAADPVELFFLQVQGSGRLRLPDGGVMRIGYASQNGRAYTGIGALMRDRGLLQPGEASMQGIVGWLHRNPEQGRAIMNENKSYVFFQELTGAGPLGAMGYAVTPRITVAADPDFVPLGAPVWVSLDRAEPNGLWIAQDTGGAIKGANRFDTFWGAGEEARAIAGGMSARGSALVLIPNASAARLGL
ncbi:murein transglycosylase A [Novosphingopyxis sp.]|uniref:murein transglycosylase A n=1 Tax=Novosphingopyxis sp. TaxID=2709690 RepID=UPI003B59F84A